MSETLSILLVEDNPGDATLVERYLRTEATPVFDTPETTHVESLDAAESRLADERFDLVLLDLGLPGTSGLDTLTSLQERIAATESVDPVPIIVLTGLDDQRRALEAIKQGAQDYLVKGDIDGDLLGRAVRYALERHRKEQELKRQNERLDRFASVVSHDLRNPLNAATTSTDIMLKQVEEGTRLHESGKRIKRATDRMADLIEDVLALARQGQAVDDTEPVDIGAVATDCWRVIEAAEAAFEVDANRTVRADPGRLRQLFENLYRNAVEHGAGDDGSVTVRVEAINGGFAVADDGPGIPEDEREDVLEAGYTTDEGGTGFGLNIVTEIASAHGWHVSVGESTEGGARFEVTGIQSA